MGIGLAADASRREVCTPTHNVRDALVKLEGLVQSWQAAVQEAQVLYDKALVNTKKPHTFHGMSAECMANGLSTYTHLPTNVHMGNAQQETQSISGQGCPWLTAE